MSMGTSTSQGNFKKLYLPWSIIKIAPDFNRLEIHLGEQNTNLLRCSPWTNPASACSWLRPQSSRRGNWLITRSAVAHCSIEMVVFCIADTTSHEFNWL